MPVPPSLQSRLALPVIAAPMFLVSGPELVAAACRAGIVGALPAHNARTADGFAEWMAQLDAELAAIPGAAPLAVNIPITRGERWQQDMDTLARHRVAIVITANGNPAEVVEAVHGYGGMVFHDVTNITHAKKAAEAGVDGLNLICGGAGGHAGTLNPFAFVPQVRRFFDGIVALAGGIADGRAIRAAQALGADLVYMGTRFIATRESRASDAYKQMLLGEQSQDILYTDAISGMAASFMRSSILQAGLDPDRLPPPKGLHRPDLPAGVKAWRDIWSAGHGVGLVDDIPGVAELVQRLRDEYAASAANPPPLYGA
jgi:nitronate monooxygenase